MAVDSNIPDIILADAKERGFSVVKYGGEYDSVPYFYYIRETKSHYCGLPSIVRVVDDVVEDVTNLSERLRAFNYVLENEKLSPI